jgi:hypothetical protein
MFQILPSSLTHTPLTRRKQVMILFLGVIIIAILTIFIMLLNRRVNQSIQMNGETNVQNQNVTPGLQQDANGNIPGYINISRAPVQKKAILVTTEPEYPKKEEAVKKADIVLEKANYSKTPLSYTLPTGDTITVEKTDFQVSDPSNLRITGDDPGYVDFRFKVGTPLNAYVVVLYEAPYVREVVKMYEGENFSGFDGYYSFDMREIQATGRGLVLFYPEGTPVTVDSVGIPAGNLLLSIPIKL